MPIVEINNLTKDYDVGFWRKRKVRALNGLSLSIEAGQIFGFLGANGAGKTTTLKLLMRLIYPTAGSARILGQDISEVAMRGHIGYLPENPYFYDYLSPREFLNYCGQLFGLKQAERKRRTESLLTRVNLDSNSWERQMRRLSKGMLQRVGLAQALINNPQIVFLDEPMSGLDPVGRREVRDLIASLRTEGKTVFMCSHILSDIEVLCDNIAILKKGELAHAGSLDELRAREGNLIEVVAAGADELTLKRYLTDGANVIADSSGLRIHIQDEKELESVIAALRKANGKVVSVQPVRQSLEDLFLD
jgi:ABC-2 type transport system ATP-binding protein